MFDFDQASRAAAADQARKTIVTTAVMRQYNARRAEMKLLPDPDALRDLAGQIRQHAIDHLDYYLDQLKTAVERNGGHFYVAANAERARQMILEIAKAADCRRVIKSKSMVSEEIGLTAHLESGGLEVVESDLGEFIAQISHDRPSHIVAPIVHKNKASIAKLFSEYFGTPYTDDPQALTLQARQHLREKFRHADMGITGANFLVAETGQVVTVENEGNVRQSVTTPRVLVSVSGIEKVIPRLIDLSVLIKLLARSATGQPMTIYTNLYGGPRAPGEKDGPQEFHLVLIDNGRSEIVAGQYRQTLRCIRCGACLNACPVYRTIGGHAYGGVYSGPIGALITPLMNGLREFRDLPRASSLCGACYEVCPVRIDIPRHLINLRRDILRRKLTGRGQRLIFRLWAGMLRSPRLYRWISRWQEKKLRRRARDGWIDRLPGPASGWTEVRDMPAPAEETFHQRWKKRKHD
ncbi:MAG TPA: LutB/LldF family L-lactate oxidation iron-sulfur protein [Tepidisphaeraceae bacterium]|nr:LutB/LldF family L-lactate oxidation iron-sulfur protein [Tepidisphaeraceae bacterium]